MVNEYMNRVWVADIAHHATPGLSALVELCVTLHTSKLPPVVAIQLVWPALYPPQHTFDVVMEMFQGASNKTGGFVNQVVP